MLFNSLDFALFLPLVFIAYWMLPHKYRWLCLLLSSLYFYMTWGIKYVFLLLFIILLSYGGAIFIKKAETHKKKKRILSITLVGTIFLLIFFKYFNFVNENIVILLQQFAIPFHPITLKILLPVGISFYTFQSMGYLIDVYRGETEPENHLGKYAAYISFFPLVLAGPIERARNFLPQLGKERHFSYDSAAYGLKLMAWGFYKKIVLADLLAIYVDRIYNDIWNYQGLSILVAAVFFTLQIYCDFSGYSDIARGTAKLFGIDLMINFKSPYFSTTLKEFWSRWHISLSSWFRDYVYIPLGGSRHGKGKAARNLMITFFVSGLWHGANWTYMIWGALHGLGQVLEKQFRPSGKQGKSSFKGISWWGSVALVFAFSSLAWIFFRAADIGQALYALQNMFVGSGNPVEYIKNGYNDLLLYKKDFLPLAFAVAILLIYDYSSLKTDVIAKVGKWAVWIRWPVYILFILFIFFMMPIQSSQFLYFDF